MTLIDIGSADRPRAWVQPVRNGGAVIGQAHSNIVLDADELVRLINACRDIERSASARTTTTPARARLVRYPSRADGR